MTITRTTAPVHPVPAGIVLKHYLTSTWKGTLGWCVALIAVVSLYVPLYPSMQDVSMQEMLASLPEDLVNTLGYNQITSGAGYVQATVLGLLGFVLLAIAALTMATATTAGVEESGELELLLAHGITRRRFATEQLIGVLLRLLLIIAVAVAMIGIYNSSAELHIDTTHLLAGGAAWLLLTWMFAAVTYAAGLITGQKSWCFGVGVMVVAFSYVAQALARSVDNLDWLNSISPYYWAYGNQPLTQGFDTVGLLALLAVTVISIVLGLIVFNRRDITA